MMTNNSEIPHQLWSCTNKMLRTRAAPLPKHTSLSYLCDVFSGDFKDNITLIQSSFPVRMLNKVNVKSPQTQCLYFLLLLQLRLRKGGEYLTTGEPP